MERIKQELIRKEMEECSFQPNLIECGSLRSYKGPVRGVSAPRTPRGVGPAVFKQIDIPPPQPIVPLENWPYRSSLN